VVKHKIQLFTPTFRVQECLDEIRICLESGWTGLGFKTVEFEEAWKSYTGHRHAHFLNSATAGLNLGLKILKDRYGWSDGDEVISTPITFISTNHAILHANLKVAFADVDQFGCLDPASVEERINSRTRAVLFVGLGGNVGQLAKIRRICERNNLRLILDAAHMAGTRLYGDTRLDGSDVVVYSFQAVKNLPTADSGMICFADIESDRVARQLSWLGIDKDTFTRTQSGGAYKWHYHVTQPGYKYHGNSIMAAIALVQLRYVDQDNAYRRQLSKWYDDELQNSNSVLRVPMSEECEPSRHLYQIRVTRRDEVLLGLNSLGIYPGVHYRTNTDYTMYSHLSHTCPNAIAFSNEVISLPLHLRMTSKDVSTICKSLLDIVDSAQG
jgi:dTDP-4-amino-4,6-dideoxygalactose transaminase